MESSVCQIIIFLLKLSTEILLVKLQSPAFCMTSRQTDLNFMVGKIVMKQGIFFFTIIIAHWSLGLSDFLDGQVKKLFLITLLWKG